MKLLLLLAVFLPSCSTLTPSEREAIFRLGLAAGERVINKATK